jgi:hypothetical protein
MKTDLIDVDGKGTKVRSKPERKHADSITTGN